MGLQSLAVLPTLFRVVRAVLGVPILLLLVLWGWHHWRYKRVLAMARKLPQMDPNSKPIIGDLYCLYHGMSGTINKLIESSKEMAGQGHRYACNWLGPYPLIWVFSPEDIHTVLTSPKTCEKSADYGFVKQALGNGLITAPSHIHKVTRRYINPLFTPGSLNQLMPLMNQLSRHLVEDLSGHVGLGQFHIARPLTPIVLTSISSVIFGPHVNVYNNSEIFGKLLKAMKCVSFILVHRLFKIWLWSDSIFEFLWRKDLLDMKKCWNSFTKKQLEIQENNKTVLNTYRTQYGKRRKSSIKESSNENENTSLIVQRMRRRSSGTIKLKVPQSKTLVECYDYIIRDNPQFNRQDLLNEMFTFMIAGSETTKVTISSCLLALAAHPQIQERVYQEIISVIGAEDKEVSMKDINSLTYLDQVMKETLRKFNIIPFILRRVREDLQLKDRVLPVGTTVGVNIIGLHFNPTTFPNPEAFDPERFSPENVAKMEKHSYLPFSGGSRSCIGKTYATFLVKVVLVHVLRRFQLTTGVDINSLRFNFGLLLYSVTGYQVALHSRSVRRPSKTSDQESL